MLERTAPYPRKEARTGCPLDSSIRLFPTVVSRQKK